MSSQHKSSQSFEAGFTMRRNATRDNNYLLKVRDIVKWIDLCAGTSAQQRLDMYGEEVFLGFFNIIRDGVLLCQAINGARPGTIPKIYTEGTIQPGRRYTFKAMQNIQFFLHAGLKLGATILPFSPMDLFERTNEFTMLDFIWNVKETVELAPGEFLLGQGPGARGRGKVGSVKVKGLGAAGAPINLPSFNEAHEREDQEERDRLAKNAVVSLRGKKKSGHGALSPGLFDSPDTPADEPSPRHAGAGAGGAGNTNGNGHGNATPSISTAHLASSAHSTPVTSPTHSNVTPSHTPPPDHTDEEFDLKVEVEAEEKLKKAHEEAAKFMPVLFVDGNAEEQDPGITLADIRVTYPGCYLKEFKGTAVFRNGGFTLERGKGYELVRPGTHDKLTEEEAADVKASHHDDDEHPDEAAHDSPPQSPPQSPGASPITSPAPSSSHSHSLSHPTEPHSAPASTSHEERSKTPPHTAPATTSAPRAASPVRVASPAKTASTPAAAAATNANADANAMHPPPPAATIGHAAVPPVAHKDASTHSDGSHSLTSLFAPQSSAEAERDAHGDGDDDGHEHETTKQLLDETAEIALSSHQGRNLSLRMQRAAGMGKTKSIMAKGSVRRSVVSASEESPQASPEVTHGNLRKQPSSPALQPGSRLTARGKNVGFADGSPPSSSATLGGGGRVGKQNYAYYKVPRKRDRIPGVASWQANEILPGLWLGDKADSNDRSTMKIKGITNVFTVACDLPPPFPNDFQYKVLDLLDSSSQNIIQYFPEAIKYIDANITNNRQTLVHCQQGVSRSATVVIAYVMYKEKMDFDSAGEHVCSRRSRVCPNFGFMQQLKQWGETLQREQAAQDLAKAQGLPMPASLIFSAATLVPEASSLNVPIVAATTSASLSVNPSASTSSSSGPSPPASPTHGLAPSQANSLATMFITPKHGSSHTDKESGATASSSSTSSSSAQPHGSPAPHTKHLPASSNSGSGPGDIQVHIIPPGDSEPTAKHPSSGGGGDAVSPPTDSEPHKRP